MSTKTYFIKLQPVNLYNLIVALLFKNAGDTAFDPCTFELDDQGLINITAGGFASSVVDNPYIDFRQYDWTTSSFPTTDKLLIIGTYRSDQLNPIKLKYNDDVLTIGISYNEENCKLLLNNLAKQHVKSLILGTVNKSELDANLLASKSSEELINYYTTAFTNQTLVPINQTVDCDYLIPLTDFYSKSAITQHLINLRLPFTNDGELFYDRWLDLNQTSV
jgi:hypothetical protein